MPTKVDGRIGLRDRRRTVSALPQCAASASRLLLLVRSTLLFLLFLPFLPFLQFLFGFLPTVQQSLKILVAAVLIRGLQTWLSVMGVLVFRGSLAHATMLPPAKAERNRSLLKGNDPTEESAHPKPTVQPRRDRSLEKEPLNRKKKRSTRKGTRPGQPAPITTTENPP